MMKGDVDMKLLGVALESSSRGPAASAKQALHARGRGCPSLRKDTLVQNTEVAPSTPMHNSCQQAVHTWCCCL